MEGQNFGDRKGIIGRMFREMVLSDARCGRSGLIMRQ